MLKKSKQLGADNSMDKQRHQLRHRAAICAGHVFEDIEKTAARYSMKPGKMIAFCLGKGVLVSYGKAGQIQCDRTELERSLKIKDLDTRAIEIR